VAPISGEAEPKGVMATTDWDYWQSACWTPLIERSMPQKKAAAETEPEVARRPRTFTLPELLGMTRDQRASLPADAGHPRDGWPA
jgi:hypothetical protein